jgi:ADP-heptose:LPS heptosyltransferase
MEKPDHIPKILVVRNDKLGDFMLAYPSFALLKQALPHSRIIALIPHYTQDMATACPWIDDIILDSQQDSGLRKLRKTSKEIRRQHIEFAISLFSTTYVGALLLLARIPYRLAPATKIAQFFYNHRLKQRRSQSAKPESVYNLDLVKHFLTTLQVQIPKDPQPPFLKFDVNEVASLKTDFCKKHGLDRDSALIFIHPGSGGSANNLSPEQYAELADALVCVSAFTVVVTAGPGELATAQAVCRSMKNVPHVIYESIQGLMHFARHIQFAHVFISGSTGPLHIAGALDVPTAAFYTRRRSATALRWQTLNSPGKRLAFSPPAGADECDMSRIDIVDAADQINCKFLS